ncbi:hypothetical protein SPRG_21051 [Saprolegnia parasitica CBS 223.65]|uniref:Uncharacterized protein n=1 Tax=Saprolegnia parasitica (strain CBS 223.65) TaxID=695850 RepID=A0A067C7V9_SAPPC|nr:hypothetical protein SPRG_21051 [Saprolegnia parasitica CBS 223.65]KDO22902.1 hypothetical protein SPRG_21051 [Saprolegnia parasitica CBS 223.65]|eukprot:XP_012206392.1 hypothetical protein SPRG_21051 [Saprolegnia parasitica CBS 223.65]
MMDLALVPAAVDLDQRAKSTLVHCLDAASSPLATLSDAELHNLSLLALCSGFDTTFFETVYARHMYFGPSIVLGRDFQDAVALYPDRVVVDTACFDSLI